MTRVVCTVAFRVPQIYRIGIASVKERGAYARLSRARHRAHRTHHAMPEHRYLCAVLCTT